MPCRDHASGEAVHGEVRVGVSRCLLGDGVRYDGGHKRDVFVADTLAPFVRYVAVCPEVEMGMGAPREAIRLVRGEDGPRLRGVDGGEDHSARMRRFAARRAVELRELDLHGYILKKDSPSCGLFHVPVFDADAGPGAAPTRDGRGSFAGALVDAIPELPMEEEGRLEIPALRGHFLERVFAYRRLQAMLSGHWRTGDLAAFHAAEKFLLLAHDPGGQAELGRLAAGAKGIPRGRLAGDYRTLFMATLSRPATVRKHVNVLRHMAGHLENLLDRGSRAELHRTIGEYRLGRAPLAVPVAAVRRFARRRDVAWLAGQTYLSPCPEELMPRDRVQGASRHPGGGPGGRSRRPGYRRAGPAAPPVEPEPLYRSLSRLPPP